MRILVGKTFGLGNAVMAIPMLKALASLGHSVDVLVGSGPDDGGVIEVFSKLMQTYPGTVDNVWVDGVPFAESGYDIAIMSIPYDGRWKNGCHYFARDILDARKRPDFIERLGFDMWKKHEVEYQMDNARSLGYDCPTPSSRFTEEPFDRDMDLVYLGIGYKRDPGGFGLSKHFGTERYIELVREIHRLHPAARFISTGNGRDCVEVGGVIVKANPDIYHCVFASLNLSWQTFSQCGSYIGNDTGAMHVAASQDLPTCGLFSDYHLMVKNPPFCAVSKGIYFNANWPTVETIARDFVNFVWGE